MWMRRKKYEQERQEWREAAADWAGMCVRAQEKTRGAEADLERAREDIRELQGQLDFLGPHAKELEEQIEALQDELEASKALTEAQAEHIRALNDRLSSLTRDREELREENRGLRLRLFEEETEACTSPG